MKFRNDLISILSGTAVQCDNEEQVRALKLELDAHGIFTKFVWDTPNPYLYYGIREDLNMLICSNRAHFLSRGYGIGLKFGSLLEKEN